MKIIIEIFRRVRVRILCVMFSTLFATCNFTFNTTANTFMNSLHRRIRSTFVYNAWRNTRMSIVNFLHLYLLRRASCCSSACNTDVFNGPTITGAVLLSRRVPPWRSIITKNANNSGRRRVRKQSME